MFQIEKVYIQSQTEQKRQKLVTTLSSSEYFVGKFTECAILSLILGWNEFYI